MTYPNLNEIAKRSHELAKKNGFWQGQETIGITSFIPEKLMLIVSELSEGLESYRKAESNLWFRDCDSPYACSESDEYLDGDGGACSVCGKARKPEGLASELADAVIRIGDLAERLGIDLAEAVELKHAYNKTRPYKHGKVC